MEIKIVDLKQRHVDAYLREIPSGDNARNMPIGLYRSMSVRAASKAGWFELPALKPEDVDDLKPWQVIELSNSINQALEEATSAPSPS